MKKVMEKSEEHPSNNLKDHDKQLHVVHQSVDLIQGFSNFEVIEIVIGYGLMVIRDNKIT